MQRLFNLLLFLFVLSCNNERVLQLPEIENANITEVLDVSPVYIFYDEAQPDSTLFNRKNLIGTTNWLVNVDKRLTLRQAIPHIQYLQNKRKKESMHKNENAKNYFTCNDTSIGNLGFVEFTDIFYHKTKGIMECYEERIIHNKVFFVDGLYSEEHYKLFPRSDIYQNLSIFINEDMSLSYCDDNDTLVKAKHISFIINKLKSLLTKSYASEFSLQVWYNQKLSFQDYISIKSELSKLKNETIKIDENEFIY